jgi:F420-dependent oxidoreductase-like protein
MMVDIGIMIEGQEDLTWERFFRLAETVEGLGFGSLFRSDHLTALEGFPERATLALWPSLTALAQRTRRIRFGPMVCSMTFRHPAMVAKMAADVDVLSGGRLDLGLGAGWYGGEHHMFGIDFPAYGARLEMLDEGAQIIKGLWSGRPFTFEGRHYQARAAQNHPRPAQAEPTIIMGGKGEKTLKVVARHAGEWNCSYVGLDIFREKSVELDENCRAIGRDPVTLRRSLMIPFVIGRDAAALQANIDAHRRVFPSLPPDHAGWLAAGYLGGSPEQLADQLVTFATAGVSRFMLQHNDLDNLDALALLAQDVLPHFA